MRFVVLMLALSGCVALRPARPVSGAVSASSPARCTSLARASELEHIFAILLGGAGTASAGIAPALTDTLTRDLVLGAGGVLGVAGAVLSYTAGVASAAYSKECQ